MAVDWRETPFAQLLTEPVRNGIYKRKEFHGRGIKIVNMGELFAYPRLRNVPMKRVVLSESEKDRFCIQSGDLLFARRSLVAEGAGKCTIVLDVTESTTFESSIIRARPDTTKSDSLFLYYYFKSPHGLHALDSIRRQVAVAGITGSDLAGLNVQIPPLSHQRVIAHILGTLDDKIELNQRMNETLEAMTQMLFKSWFVDFDPVRAKAAGRDPGLPQSLADLFPARLVPHALGEIPEGWTVRNLGDVAEHIRHSAQPHQIDPETPYIGLENMPKRCIALSDWTTGGVIESNKFEFRRGDLLFGKLRPYFHKVGVAPIDGVCSTDIVVVRPQQQAWFGLVLGHVSSVEFIHHADAGSTGTRMPRTNWNEMARYRLALPPVSVAKSFDTLIRSSVERIISNIHESRTLASQRDALLPKLTSGELRIKDGEQLMERSI